MNSLNLHIANLIGSIRANRARTVLIRTICWLSVLACFTGESFAGTFTTAASGNWNSPATWGLTGTPAEGVNYPGANDNVTVNNGYDVSLTANQSCYSLTVQAKSQNNTTSSLNTNSYTMTIGVGGLTISGGGAGGTRYAAVNVGTNGTLTVRGPVAIANNKGEQLNLTGSPCTLNIDSTMTYSGTNTVLNPGTASTVNFAGTTAQTLDVVKFRYVNITINNSSSTGVMPNAALTATNVGGNVAVQSGIFDNGGFSIAGNTSATFEVDAGATFNVSGTSSFPTSFQTVLLNSLSTVNYTGTTQTIDAQKYGNLTLSGSGTKTITGGDTVASALTLSNSGTTTLNSNIVVGSFDLTAGTFVDNGNTITVYGGGTAWTKGGGTYTATGTVAFTGTKPTIGSSNFPTLQISVAANDTAIASGSLSATNFTLSSGIFNPGSYTHTISANFTLNSGTKLLVTQPIFSSNYSKTPTANAGSTVEYQATNSTLANFTYSNLNITGTVTGGSTATISGAFNISNSFIPSGGTITFSSGSSIVNSGTLIFSNATIAASTSITTGSSFGITGTFSVVPSASFTDSSGTVTLTNATVSNSNSDPATLTFKNLVLSGSVTANTNFTVNGTFSGSGTLNAASGTIVLGNNSALTATNVAFYNLTIGGAVTANVSYTVSDTMTVGAAGNLSPASGTVTLSGATLLNNGTLAFKNLIAGSTVTMNASFSVTGSFTNNGTVNQASGVVTFTAGDTIYNSSSLSFKDVTISGSVVGAGSFTVNGVLTLNADLTMGGNTLTMGASATTAGTYDVWGNVHRVSFSVGTGYSFGNQFTTITIDSATAVPTSVTITITNTAPGTMTDAILRTYNITSSGGSNYYATLRFHFRSGDLNSNTADALDLWKNPNPTSYADFGRSDYNLTDMWVKKVNITALTAEYTLKNKMTANFVAGNSGNWNNPHTWGFPVDTAAVAGETYPGSVDNVTIGDNFSVTLTAAQSGGTILVQGSNSDGTTALNVANYTLTVGNGGLTITGGTTDARTAEVLVSGGTLNSSGNITLSTSSAVRAVLDLSGAAGSQLIVGKSLAMSSTGTFVPGSSSTVTFNGTSAQTMDVNNFKFANIVANNSAGVQLNGNIFYTDVNTYNVSGNLKVLGGTFDNAGHAISGNPLDTFSVASGATFTVGGTSGFPTNFAAVSLDANSTVNYNGTTQTIVQQTYGNLIISGSGSKSLLSSLTVLGTLTHSSSGTTTLSSTSGNDITVARFSLSNGTFTDNGRMITVTGTGAGTWSVSGGSFASTGTVSFTGTAPQIGATTFDSLQINVGSGNTATAIGALTATNFKLMSGKFDPGSYGHNFTSTFFLNSGTTVYVRTSSFAANYATNPTLISSGSTVEYSATGLTLANLTYANLTISGTATSSMSATVGGTLAVSNSFTPSGGTITLNNGAGIANTGSLQFYNLTLASGAIISTGASFGVKNGTFTVNGGASFTSTGTDTLNGTTLSNSGTVTFQNLVLLGTVTANATYTVNGTLSGSGNLAAASGTVTLGNNSSFATSGTISLFNLTVSGTTTVNASFSITDTLSVGASGNLSPGSGTVTISGGTIINNGVLTFANLTTSGTVTMNTSFGVNGIFSNSGTITQTSGTLTTNTGATISNSGSLTLFNFTVSGNTTGSGNFTVNGTMTANATLAMGADTLTMGSTAVTSQSGSGDVTGNVKRTSFSTGTAYSFGNYYTSVTFNAGSTVPTSVTMNIGIGSAPSEKTDAIKRIYTITASGGSYTSTLRLHYSSADLNGNNAILLELWEKSNGVYVEAGRSNKDETAGWAEQDTITALTNSWTLANNPSQGFTAAASGNWNSGATWGHSGNDVEGSGYPGPNDVANVSSNFTVTLAQDQSCLQLVMTSATTNGTSTLAVGNHTLSVGTSGIALNGGARAARNIILTIAGGKLNISGNIAVDATSNAEAAIDLTGAAGGTINISGNIAQNSNADGILKLNSTSTINFNGSGAAQTFDPATAISGNYFATVLFNNTSSGGVVLAGNITTTNVTGDMRVQAGVFKTNGYTVAGNTGKTFEIANGTTLYLAGTSSFPSGFTALIGSTSTVNYNGGSQAIADEPYGNLILSGNGVKTVTSSLSMTGNFTYSSTAWSALSGTSGQDMTARSFTQAAGTFSDSGRTITITGTNAQVWTNSGGTFQATGTVNITGAGSSIGTANFDTLNINVGIGNTASANGALNVNTLTITTGTFDPKTYIHTISTSFTVGQGTTLLVNMPTFAGNFSLNPTTQTGSTVNYTNSNATISNAFTYRNLTISGGVSGAANATVNETFAVSGTFTPSSGNITLNNGATITNSGTATFRSLTIGSNDTVTTSSSFTIVDSLTVGSGGIFQSSGTITLKGVFTNNGSITFNNLTVNAPVTTSASFTVNGLLNILTSGDLSPSGGTITMSGGSSISNIWNLKFNNLTIAGTVTGNTSFSVGGTLTVNATGNYSPTGGKVTLQHGAVLSNSGILAFNNLTIADTVTANTSYTIDSALSVGSSGYLVATSGTVTMNGGGTIANTGALTLNNFTISNGNVTAGNNFIVSGTLTLNGNLSMSSYTLDLGTTSTISGTGDVTGNVRRSGSLSTGVAYSFGSQFTTINFASGTLPTSITINITTGSAPPEKPEAILRYYTVTTSGGGSYSATVQLRFLSGELNGNDASTLSLWQKVGVNPYLDQRRTSNDLVNNWVSKASIASIAGTWALSKQSPLGFNAVISGNWNSGATWGNSGNDVEGSGYPGVNDIANISNNVTVTLTADQSCTKLYVYGHSVDGTSMVGIGSHTLSVGTGGVEIAGGTTDARIAEITVSGGTLSVNGNVTFNSPSAVRAVLDMSLSANSMLSLTGSMTKSSAGTFTPGISGTVNFTGTAGGQTLNVASFTFADVYINNTSGSGVTANGNITASNVTANIRVQTGFFSNGGYSISGNASDTFQVASGTALYLVGTTSFPTGFVPLLSSTSTVYYSGGAQTVDSLAFGNLTLSGTGGKTVTTGLVVSGTFTYSSSGLTSLSSTSGRDLTCSKFAMSAGTFADNGRTITVTGSGSGTWQKTGGTFTATGTTAFTGASPQIGASNFGTLQVNVGAGNTATASGNLTAANFTLQSGTFDPGNNLIAISSAFSLSSGITLKVNTSTFTGNYSLAPTSVASGSTVEYTNSSATVAGAFLYSNLKISGTVSGSSTASVSGTFTVAGTFNNPGGTITMKNGGSIAVSGGTLNFTNLTIDSNATVSSAASFGINGTLQGNSGATFAPAGTITMNGGSTISNTGTLTFSTLSIAGSVTANTSFRISGTLSVGASGNLSPASGTITVLGTSTIANSGVLKFATLVDSGTVTTSSNFAIDTALIVGASGSATASAGTITMNGGSSIQNSGSLTFYNLTCAAGSAVTSSSNFSVSGILSVASSATFNPTGTVTMNSGASFTISGTDTLKNVTIAGGTVTGNTNISVKGVLTLNGTLSMGANTLWMDSSAAASGSGDVSGNVNRTVMATGVSYSFGNQYTTITFASGTPPTSLTVDITIGTAPTGKTDGILRKYAITESGGSGYSATLRLHYLDAELNGNTASSLTVWEKISGVYSNQGKTNSDQVNKWVEKSGFSSLGTNWTLANQPAAGFTTSASGSWSVGATWGNPGNNVEGSGYPGPTDIATINNNLTVTLDGNRSVYQLKITGSSVANGTSTLNIGSYSLNIGGGGITLTQGNTNSRIAQLIDTSGILTVDGDITFTASSAAAAVVDMSAGAGTLNLSGNLTLNTVGTFNMGTSSAINFNGSTINQIVNVTNFTYANVVFNNTSSSGATIGAAITTTNVTGNIEVQSGTFSNGGFAIAGNAGKSFAVDSAAVFKLTGTSGFPTGFSTTTLHQSSTVEYAGGTQTLSNLSYGNLTLSGSGTKTIASALSVAGTFTYSCSVASSLSSTVGQDLTANSFVMNSGTFSDNGRNIIVTGTGGIVWVKNGGTFNATGKVKFIGASPQIGVSNFDTLEIAAGTATAAGILTPTHFVLTSGTFDPSSYGHTITTNFTLAAGTTLLVRGAEFVTNYSKVPTQIDPSSTIEYSSSSAQTISPSPTYGNLVLAGGGSNAKTAGGNLKIAGNMTINSGATFDG
ncbi:MAG: hypothetical protein KGJ59_04300, partial [Bacteroidota bacterium]|nr:hypothetical protein [Bacteroidota bacterium]